MGDKPPNQLVCRPCTWALGGLSQSSRAPGALASPDHGLRNRWAVDGGHRQQRRFVQPVSAGAQESAGLTLCGRLAYSLWEADTVPRFTSGTQDFLRWISNERTQFTKSQWSYPTWFGAGEKGDHESPVCRGWVCAASGSAFWCYTPWKCGSAL